MNQLSTAIEGSISNSTLHKVVSVNKHPTPVDISGAAFQKKVHVEFSINYGLLYEPAVEVQKQIDGNEDVILDILLDIITDNVSAKTLKYSTFAENVEHFFVNTPRDCHIVCGLEFFNSCQKEASYLSSFDFVMLHVAKYKNYCFVFNSPLYFFTSGWECTSRPEMCTLVASLEGNLVITDFNIISWANFDYDEMFERRRKSKMLRIRRCK